MRWTAAALIRPITFVLAIVAAVLVGDHTDSFWYGVLGFFIAFGAGRVIGALIRGRWDKAWNSAIWPAAATAYALLFAALGLPPVANFFVAWIAASLTRNALPHQRRWQVTRTVRRIDLDELLP